mmetsp:Transcript_27337/g.41154  ORF Transcript_27337/g.41154 Transcript_27337/m.41154 type:complete len:628 (+) Transcript_27337:80-1963(+)|eukprot:CAMPEP_0203681706 /NCGR_PEP_ID=MMETSP0090-20130426/43500_1 /ASSEMBLY_ACC=CAM_ASM_001088 /TAXON_ID=426623 /ORGANISM="Chaetoceros affinis, Strain CCMP159" /LENGTH=627 /DNA_ID=CAMNT_0050550293 /DNA_START=1 /DNA_END=1884 /DNA_ORIENTATION=-
MTSKKVITFVDDGDDFSDDLPSNDDDGDEEEDSLDDHFTDDPKTFVLRPNTSKRRFSDHTPLVSNRERFGSKLRTSVRNPFNPDFLPDKKPLSAKADMKLKHLEVAMRNQLVEYNNPLIFLHPHQERDQYTEKELSTLPQRDFQTRLFVSSVSFMMNSLWVRNHHSDIVATTSNFTFIRDYFKAAFATKNHTAAKTILSAELKKWLDLNDYEYYTFATILASGLSKGARNTNFEINKAMVPSHANLPTARMTFLYLMDILFSKVYVKTFLYKENNSNIFRIAHCDTKHSKNKIVLIYALFSFLLQTALTLFVLFKVLPFDIGSDFKPPEFEETSGFFVLVCLLASFGACYSMMIIKKEYDIASEVYRFYSRIGPLYIIDLTVNLVLPVILLVSGFLIIIDESDLIDAVLNTAALLFIPEIDDRLPNLLGYDEEATIEDFLIAEAKSEYSQFVQLNENNTDLNEVNYMFNDRNIGLPFNDVFITNSIEQGASAQTGSLYQPHIIEKNAYGHEIDPSNYVTPDCLLKSVEWRYTTFDTKTTSPRVGYLKLTKLSGEVVEVKYEGPEALDVGEAYVLNGVFIITDIVMSSSILTLRLCGSDTAKNFVKAFNYYSLWEIDGDARRLLDSFA